MIVILPTMKQMFQGDGGTSKIERTVAENVRAQLWHIIESRDMLFLQDPLGSCKGNDSVIQS